MVKMLCMLKRIYLFTLMLLSWQLSVAQQTAIYESAFSEIEKMLATDSTLNFRKAVFIVENAYCNNQLDESTFNRVLTIYASLCQNLASTKLVEYDKEDKQSVNRHAAIFKLMTDTIPIYLTDMMMFKHPPFEYNFDDYAGKFDWRNTFVTTLLDTHKGNCHSLPILYKLISDAMGEKAWLSLAPNHFYIKTRNKELGWYNTELTSGQFPSDAWLKSSGYIHLNAIKNGIYMDTLSMRNSVALCLVDLAQGYQYKYRYTHVLEFVLKCCDTALTYFPNYINALLLKAETLLKLYQKSEVKNEEAFRIIEELYAQIHQLGYRKMPEKMYLEWLSSLKEANGVYQYE